MVAIVVGAAAMLAFMPHAPAPLPVHSRTAVSPEQLLPLPIVHARSAAAPRCPMVEAADPLRSLAVVGGLVVFGGLPFILAQLQPPKEYGNPAGMQFDQTFLAENKAKEGVVTLPSGLQYKVLRAGDGGSHPLADSPCACHYEGRLAKDWPGGKTFDSSYDRGAPTTFAPNQVIKGWTEAMQLMVEGDKWEMYLPSNLAYGDNGRVPGCLVFTMEIIKINGGTTPKVA